MSTGTCEPKRAVVAAEILNNLAALADSAAETADRADSTLEPICRLATPEREPAGTTQSEYPPLFSEMRGQMDKLEGSLRRLNDTLERCEI